MGMGIEIWHENFFTHIAKVERVRIVSALADHFFFSFSHCPDWVRVQQTAEQRAGPFPLTVTEDLQ